MKNLVIATLGSAALLTAGLVACGQKPEGRHRDAAARAEEKQTAKTPAAPKSAAPVAADTAAMDPGKLNAVAMVVTNGDCPQPFDLTVGENEKSLKLSDVTGASMTGVWHLKKSEVWLKAESLDPVSAQYVQAESAGDLTPDNTISSPDQQQAKVICHAFKSDDSTIEIPKFGVGPLTVPYEIAQKDGSFDTGRSESYFLDSKTVKAGSSLIPLKGKLSGPGDTAANDKTTSAITRIYTQSNAQEFVLRTKTTMVSGKITVTTYQRNTYGTQTEATLTTAPGTSAPADVQGTDGKPGKDGASL